MKRVHLLSAALLSLCLVGAVGCSSKGSSNTDTGSGNAQNGTEQNGTAGSSATNSLGRVTNFDRGAWYSGDSMYNANNGYRSVENSNVMQETKNMLGSAGNAVKDVVTGR